MRELHHNFDIISSACPCVEGALNLLLGVLLLRQHESHSEGTSLAKLRIDIDIPSELLDDHFCYIEAKPNSLVVNFLCFLQVPEYLEELLLVILFDSCAIVGHLNLNLAKFAGHRVLDTPY